MTTQPFIAEKTLSQSDLDVLLPQNTAQGTFTTQWGSITEVSPLRVKIDGPDEDEDSAIHSTLDATVTIGDRVLCLLSGSQLIIVGHASDDDVDTDQARASTSPTMPIELGAGVNLNDILIPGYYTQNNNVEASGGTNYPEPYAGMLEVFGTTASIPLTYEEMARNYARDPRATAYVANGGLGWGNGRWHGSGGGTGTYTLRTAQTDGPVLSDGTTKLATYIRKTWTVLGTGFTDMGFEHSKQGVNAYPAVPLDPYAVSSFIRSSVDYGDGIASGARVSARFFNSAGTIVGADVDGPWQILQAGVWTRIDLQLTVPAGVAFVLFSSDIEGVLPPLSMVLDGTGLLVEKEANLEDYYDGSYALSAEVPAMWTGAVNNSESILRLVATTQPSMVWHRYTPYGVQGSKFFTRSMYNGIWYPSASTWNGYGTVAMAGTVDASTWYWKKADGELICRGSGVFALVQDVYMTYTWNYPVPFVGENPDISVIVNTTVPQNTHVAVTAEGLTSVGLRFLRSTTASTTINYAARGRWK